MTTHSWVVDAVLLGVICIIGITLGLVAKQATQSAPPPQSTRYCTNTMGFRMSPTSEAPPDFPEYVPCKFLKLEQNV